MGRKQQDDISIDDFHPRNDGFVQTYTGDWKEQGMTATAWLAPVEREHFPRGLFLRDAYELSSPMSASREDRQEEHVRRSWARSWRASSESA